MAHEHDWGPYPDVPYGEIPGRFRQCKDCGVIAYLKIASYRTLSKNPPTAKIRPYVCAVQGCDGEAVIRVKGRRGPKLLWIWMCAKHKDNPEQFLEQMKS